MKNEKNLAELCNVVQIKIGLELNRVGCFTDSFKIKAAYWNFSGNNRLSSFSTEGKEDAVHIIFSYVLMLPLIWAELHLCQGCQS